jgi:hypothetical protein
MSERGRIITPEAWARRLIFGPGAWEQILAEAETHGFGQYTFGSHRYRGGKPGHMTITFGTLVPAVSYANAEALEGSPILFTRNADQEIVLPGRWWQELVTWPVVVDTTPPEWLRQATQDLAGSDLVNAIVPRTEADDSQLVLLPDLSGRLVAQEVLLPGTEAFVSFPQKWLDQLQGSGAP